MKHKRTNKEAVEADLKLVEYMLLNRLEPEFNALAHLLNNYASLGPHAPPIPPNVVLHLVKRLRGQNGRPLRVLTLEEYATLSISTFDRKDTKEQKVEKAAAIQEIARRRSISAGAMGKIMTQLRKEFGPKARKKPR